MLNQIHIEGYVTRKQWTYDGDTFFRLAAYRDPDRPRKASESDNAGKRDRPDYVTIRVPAMLMSGLPVQFESGQRIQVHGYLESREYDYTLAEFLDDAGEEIEVDPEQAQRTTANRTTTWITAERIVVVPKGSRKRTK